MNENMDSELRSSRDDIQLVSSFINLERRRLKSGCYEDCIDALDTISFRIEILSFLDNFFFAGDYNDRVPADAFLEEAVTMLMGHYSADEQHHSIDVSGTIALRQCRDLCLILNELLVPWARSKKKGCNTSVVVAISCNKDVLHVRLSLAPTPQKDKEINMIVVSDLLKQHDGDLSSQSGDGLEILNIVFPLSRNLAIE